MRLLPPVDSKVASILSCPNNHLEGARTCLAQGVDIIMVSKDNHWSGVMCPDSGEEFSPCWARLEESSVWACLLKHSCLSTLFSEGDVPVQWNSDKIRATPVTPPWPSRSNGSSWHSNMAYYNIQWEYTFTPYTHAQWQLSGATIEGESPSMACSSSFQNSGYWSIGTTTKQLPVELV